MKIPSSSPGHTRSACFTSQEPSTPSIPIKEGVNSHRINFQLSHLPNLAKVSTVVGASCGESSKVDDAIDNLKPRLLALCKKGSCLVSFGSRNSCERIQQNSSPALKFNSSSLIEQVLVQIKTCGTTGITLSDTVKLTSIHGQKITNEDGQDYLEGQIRFQILGEPTERTIDFLEFCPEYNGNSLSSKALLSALSHLPNTGASDKAASTHTGNPTGLQFYSASGIGRSASLAVLYSFKEMCKQHNGFPVHEVQGHLNTLIRQGREQRSKYFVNSREQEMELLQACVQVNNQINEQKKQAHGKATCTDIGTLENRKEVSIHAETLTNRDINQAIVTLATDQPTFNEQPDTLPYMPINLNGIAEIASNNNYQFPALSIEQAKTVSADVLKAGFYGDALGAELESAVYRNKKLNLISAAGYANEETFNDCVQTPSEQDQVLIHQLKQNNRQQPWPTLHRATERLWPILLGGGCPRYTAVYPPY